MIWRVSPKMLLLSIFLRIMQGLLPVLQLYVTKELVDAVTETILRGPAELRTAYGFLLLQALLLMIGMGLKAVERLATLHMQLQADYYFDHLVAVKAAKIPLTYYDQTAFYDQMQRASSGHGQRGIEMINAAMQIVQNTLTLIGYIGVIFSLHWALACGLFVFTIPSLWMNLKLGTSRYTQMLRQTPIARKVNYLMQVLKGKEFAKELRIFSFSHYLIERWKTLFWKNASEQVKLEQKAAGITLAVDGFGSLAGVAAIGFVIWLAAQGEVTLGMYVAITQALLSSQSILQMMALSISRMFQNVLYISELFRFLHIEDEEVPSHPRRFPAPLTECIAITHLSYAYPGRSEKVLHDITFRISPGQTIAIVGDNGAGKTTLVKCLLGLYRNYEGHIAYDDVEVREMASGEMYAHMSGIFQDFGRYQMTARENIGFGKVERMGDAEALQAAATESGADAVIRGLDRGYDTELGPMFAGGRELSYGQWQKIALARALFRDAEVVALDEPTASMDPLAEAEVFEQFSRIATGRTAILISHRLGSCKHADHILVLDKGRLIEQGTHEELMRLNGKYAAMFTTQAKWYQDELLGE